MTLSALAPRRGELLWDIGAGSGSIAIEWMLRRSRQPRHRDRARTASAPRASRRNALALGVPALRVVDGARARGAGRPAATATRSSSAAARARRRARELFAALRAGRPAGRQRGDARDAGRADRGATSAAAANSSQASFARADPVGRFTAGGRRCRSCNGGRRSHGRTDRDRRRLPQGLPRARRSSRWSRRALARSARPLDGERDCSRCEDKRGEANLPTRRATLGLDLRFLAARRARRRSAARC